MKKLSVCKLLASVLIIVLLAGGCSSRNTAEQQISQQESESEASQPQEPEVSEPEQPKDEQEPKEEEEESQPEESSQPQLSAANPVTVANLSMRTGLDDYKVGGNTITVLITNDSASDLLTDQWYSIERYTDYGWTPLQLPTTFASGPVWLEANSTQELEIALYADSVAYTEGRYRVIKEVLSAEATGEEQARQQIAAEFTLS